MMKHFKSMLMAVPVVFYLYFCVGIITGYEMNFIEWLILYVPTYLFSDMHAQYHRKLFEQH